jgi:uncharacterized damage-inducible protein DinB
LDLESIELLYAYDAWANRRTIAGCESLSNEQFVQTVGGSFGSVRNTLAHIMDVEWLYLERWYGHSPAELPTAENYPALAQIKDRWKTIDDRMAEFLSKLSPQTIAAYTEFRSIKGITFRHPLWQMMQHLVNHSTYHRGQVTVLLRQLGATPQATDLIAFYRERSGQS